MYEIKFLRSGWGDKISSTAQKHRSGFGVIKDPNPYKKKTRMTTEQTESKGTITNVGGKGRSRCLIWTKQFGTDDAEQSMAREYSLELERKLQTSKGSGVDWHIWSIEKGEEGRWHLQGASVFKNARTKDGARKYLGVSWVDIMNGKPENSVDYVTHTGKHLGKKGTWLPDSIKEIGNRPVGQGIRTDLDELHEDIKKGHRPDLLWDTHFTKLMKYPRVLDNYRKSRWGHLKRLPRDGIDIEVWCGDPGVGKSHEAYEWAEKNNAYWRSGQEKCWWDEYDGERSVVIEEFDWKVIPIDMLKVWLDKYPCRVPQKGSSSPLLANKFLITCNDHPARWYPEASLVHRRALARRMRVKVIIDVDADVEAGPQWVCSTVYRRQGGGGDLDYKAMEERYGNDGDDVRPSPGATPPPSVAPRALPGGGIRATSLGIRDQFDLV